MTSAQDVVDFLTAESGIPFVRDVWVKQPAGNYGTVAISQERILWADNKPVLKQARMTISLYTPGTGDMAAMNVEAAILKLPKLRSMTKGETAYLDGDDLMSRSWAVTLEGGYHG